MPPNKKPKSQGKRKTVPSLGEAHHTVGILRCDSASLQAMWTFTAPPKPLSSSAVGTSKQENCLQMLLYSEKIKMKLVKDKYSQNIIKYEPDEEY